MLRHLLKTQLHHGDKSHCHQKFGQRRRAGRWEWQAGHWRCSRGNKNQNELVIAVVKNGRTVYLQPAVKLPLVRFMPTLGPQRPAPFFAKGTPIPSTLHSNYADGCHIRPQIWGTQDEHGKLGRKVGGNGQPFSLPHVEHVHRGVCIFSIINARGCVCVASPPPSHPSNTPSCQDRTTHGEELLTPWSHL